VHRLPPHELFPAAARKVRFDIVTLTTAASAGPANSPHNIPHSNQGENQDHNRDEAILATAIGASPTRSSLNPKEMLRPATPVVN
jgi:hypothetical protein